MKKYLSIFILLSSCVSNRNVGPNYEIEVALENTFKTNLAFGEISIRFSKIEDSRCPENLVCVWAGEVIVTFDLILNQKQYSNLQLCLQCDQNSGTPQEMMLENRTIKLIAVHPYPNSEKKASITTAIFKVN